MVKIRHFLLIATILCVILAGFAGIAEAEENAEEITVEFAQAMDEDELAAGYINSVMPARRMLRVARPSGPRNLNGANLKLYIALRRRISEVAAGSKSSTAFSISAGEIFDQCSFTAEDLGVDELGMLDEDEGEYGFYISTTRAFNAKLSEMVREIDFPAVLVCLMADFPYDLYWFNKSYIGPTNTFDKQISNDYTEVEIAGDYQITFVVSPDYALEYLSDEGEMICNQTEVDPFYGQSVTAAAENAAEILAENQGKSDYEKLCAYRDAICGMTEYNNEVNDDTPYGDPWQLIWVFDGDPNTKVVCEGYAKAFQYLCDQGTESVTTISVQGEIPEGRHMWNIVTIGKRNYLTDLTNYDNGFDLFLRGYSDGDVASGYYILCRNETIVYTYRRELTGRTDRELTLSRWDYSKVRLAGDAVLPEGLAEIEAEAFAGAIIRSVTVPAGCTRIGERAFADSMLEEIYLASSETVVAENAFEGIEDYVTVHWP